MNDFPLIQRLVGIGAGVVMLGAVLWLIAKRRLAISYSLLWVAISLVSIGFCASYGVAAELFRSLGITPLSASFFLAVIFLVLLNKFLCVRLSKTERDMKNIAQEVTLRTGPPPALS